MRQLKNTLKHITIIYFAMGVPFALLLMLMNYVTIGTSFSWGEFLWLSMFSCAVHSFFFLNWLPLRKLFDDKAYDDEIVNTSAVTRQKQIVSTNTKNDLMLKLKSSQYFAKAKIINLDGKIRIIKGMTFKSWGEIINIKIAEAEGKYEYNIVSMPKQQMTIFDFGVNKKNVEQIENLLIAS